jgi:hypothetical protein
MGSYGMGYNHVASMCRVVTARHKDKTETVKGRIRS